MGRGGAWDRASERRVYPAIAANPDLNHSTRNQNSLKRESARVLFTRCAPRTRPVRQQRPRSALFPHTRSRSSGLSAALHAPGRNKPSAPSGLGPAAFCSQSCPVERALQVPEITRHAGASANTNIFFFKKNYTRGTSASSSTRDTLPAESPGDDGLILPCPSDPSLAGNPRTMAEPARPH